MHPQPQMPTSGITDKPPPSCVGWLDSLVALTAMFTVFFALRNAASLDSSLFSGVLMAAVVFTVGILEVLRASWRKIPPSTEAFSVILRRAVIKIFGFLSSLAVIAFIYWLFPEYRRSYYDVYFELLFFGLPWLPVLTIAYFILAEWRIPAPKDGTMQMGLFMLGRWGEMDWTKFKMNALGLLVKAYFLPIMFGDMANAIAPLRAANWNLLDLSFLKFYQLIFDSTITFELVFVAAGYAFTSRFFNSQLRAVETTFFGWFIALVSYGPFISLFYVRYMNYQNGISWSHWLDGNPMLLTLWGSTILILMAIHMWCDACFGVHFSNLTHRGIITNGAYRFCKHPAYITKSIRWWMVSVPFVPVHGWESALRASLLLVMVCIVYILRSRAEEKLLSQDPVYIAYARWLDRHGIFNWLGRWFPIITYENRLKKWLARQEITVWHEEEKTAPHAKP